MAEYISKTKFEELMRKKARNNFDLYYADGSKHYHAKAIGYSIAADEAHEFPAADVQSINQWISVKDRLPDKFDYVLCYCKTTTGEGNEFMFGAFHNDTWWLKTCRTYATLEQPQMRVMYWMPLPDPPKDGDTE